MQVLIISATALEINAFREKIQQEPDLIPHQVDFLITGPGLLAASFAITKALTENKPALAIQAGLAGTYSPAFPPGTVAGIASEEVFDCGVVESGRFKTLFDLGLSGEQDSPYTNRVAKSGYGTLEQNRTSIRKRDHRK